MLRCKFPADQRRTGGFSPHYLTKNIELHLFFSLLPPKGVQTLSPPLDNSPPISRPWLFNGNTLRELKGFVQVHKPLQELTKVSNAQQIVPITSTSWFSLMFGFCCRRPLPFEWLQCSKAQGIRQRKTLLPLHVSTDDPGPTFRTRHADPQIANSQGGDKNIPKKLKTEKPTTNLPSALYTESHLRTEHVASFSPTFSPCTRHSQAWLLCEQRGYRCERGLSFIFLSDLFFPCTSLWYDNNA